MHVKASLVSHGRSAQTRSLNESRQQIIGGDFLPKVDANGATVPKSKEKLNITHYYTQSQKQKDNQWMAQGG